MTDPVAGSAGRSARTPAPAGRGVARLRRWLCALALVPAAATGAAATPSTLTLAVADIPHAAPVLIAEARGMFAAEGLALAIVHCPIGRVCLQQLLDGKAHFATAADVPIALAGLTRKDFAIVATTTLSGRENRLIVRQDRGIRTAADLKGKRIGTLVGTSGHYFTESALVYSGLKLTDVTIVPLDPGDAIGPLQRGEIDAIGVFEPHGREALRRLGAMVRTLPMPELVGTTFNLVSVLPAAGARDDDVARLLRALQRANAFIHDQPEQARKILAGALKRDPQALAESWDDFDFRLQLGQPLVTTLEAQARWAMRDRPTETRVPMPDYLDLIRAEPLQRLDPRAVRLVK